MGYNVTMLQSSFYNRVGGVIGPDACEQLALQVNNVPKDGVILDLECGEGRSTLSMAFALNEDHGNVKIIAVDTHVTDLRSSTPYEDGTIMKFLKHLQHYKVMSRVIPMLMPTSSVLQVLNKRCANLVVVNHRDNIVSTYCNLAIALNAIRRNGRIAVCYPSRNNELEQKITSYMETFYFTLIVSRSGIMIYECSKKGG